MCVICTIKLEIIYYRKGAKSIGILSMILYYDRSIVLLIKLNTNPLVKYKIYLSSKYESVFQK